MRGRVAAGTVVVAMALGGLPGLALATASGPTGTASPRADDQHSDDQHSDDRHDDQHSDDRHSDDREHGRNDTKRSDREPEDAGQPGWLTKQQRTPPGWARHHDGQPHGFAMRAWAHCASQSAPRGQDKGSDAERACGARPAPPGLARR